MQSTSSFLTYPWKSGPKLVSISSFLSSNVYHNSPRYKLECRKSYIYNQFFFYSFEYLCFDCYKLGSQVVFQVPRNPKRIHRFAKSRFAVEFYQLQVPTKPE